MGKPTGFLELDRAGRSYKLAEMRSSEIAAKR